MRAALWVLLVCCGLLAGCSGDAGTGPSPVLVTDRFSGTLAPSGTSRHLFTVASPGGDVDVTLVSVGPPATISIGVGIGTPNGEACDVAIGVTTPAGPSPQVLGSAGPGTYCVVVADVGNLISEVSYSLTVTHP